MPRKARPSQKLSPSSTTPSESQAARRAVFKNCQHVSVSGGTFNVQAGITDVDESDFRRVRLGDLRLVKEVTTQDIVASREIPHKRTGAVKRRVPEVVGVRKVHHARVVGFQEDFTAIVYEGSDFEKHRHDAGQREDFRHPSLVQLFGVTSSGRLKALIYHDGLMPLGQFRKIFKQSVLVAAYLEYEMGKHFYAALQHWDQVTGKWLLVPDSYGYLGNLETGAHLWVYISTGQLCIEVNENEEQNPTYLPWIEAGSSIAGLHLTSHTSLEDDTLLSNMSLDDIHRLLSGSSLGNWIKTFEPGTIVLGSLCWPTPNCTQWFTPYSEISVSGLGLGDVWESAWKYTDLYFQPNKGLVILPNGWTRVALADLPIRGECQLRKRIPLTWEADVQVLRTWLSQANHVMSEAGLNSDQCYLLTDFTVRCKISSNVDEFSLNGTFLADSPSDDIYLFLFPAAVEASGGQLTVHLPPKDEMYYWSYDPEGIEYLSEESLDQFALPRVDMVVNVLSVRWSQSQYDAIGDFHRAKGYDPLSQHVAIALGYPLVDVDRLKSLINGDKIVEVVDEVEGQDEEAIMYSSLM